MIIINNEIERLDFSREPRGLYEPIGYTLAGGGKRVRPTLALTACRLFGGQEESVLPVALALEVFHNFTLLHDDLMDKADTRRGRQTVWKKWDANTAVLSGDQMLIEAYKLLAQLPAEQLAYVLPIFNRMATEICEGQQLDMDFEGMKLTEVSIADYMEMIRLKTSVLLASALQMGALIAGADEVAQEALYNFGIKVGLAFQIQDDLLDCFGDAATFGKPIGGDILEGKKTYMLLTAYQQGGEAFRTQLEALRTATPADKIRNVCELYNRLGVRQRAEEAIETLTREALAYLNGVPQNEDTAALRSLAEKLASREK